MTYATRKAEVTRAIEVLTIVCDGCGRSVDITMNIDPDGWVPDDWYTLVRGPLFYNRRAPTPEPWPHACSQPCLVKIAQL